MSLTAFAPGFATWVPREEAQGMQVLQLNVLIAVGGGDLLANFDSVSLPRAA